MYIDKKGLQFSNRDAWNVDMTLNPIIAKCIRKYMEQKDSDWFGHPQGTTKEEWLVILEKICYAFESTEPKMPDGVLELRRSKAREDGGMRWDIGTANQEVYDRVIQETKKWQAKKEEGRLLFAEYYESLWW